jgi:hypothetical protein
MTHSNISKISAAALITATLALACNSAGGPTAPSTSSEAAPRGASLAATQVPFKGTFKATGTASAVAGDRCPVLTVEIHGTGKATHLGQLTDDQSHCVDPASLAFTDGEFTFTAANGDQIRGTYFGELVPLDPPLFTIDGHFTITGGTGRFAGATGGGDASGVQNLATGDVTVSLVGTISSVGSNQGSS